jgi:hypothetical protein
MRKKSNKAETKYYDLLVISHKLEQYKMKVYRFISIARGKGRAEGWTLCPGDGEFGGIDKLI